MPECGEAWDLVKDPKAETDFGGENKKVRGHTFVFTKKRDAIVPGRPLPKSEDFKADWEHFAEDLAGEYAKVPRSHRPPPSPRKLLGFPGLAPLVGRGGLGS